MKSKHFTHFKRNWFIFGAIRANRYWCPKITQISDMQRMPLRQPITFGLDLGSVRRKREREWTRAEKIFTRPGRGTWRIQLLLAIDNNIDPYLLRLWQ